MRDKKTCSRVKVGTVVNKFLPRPNISSQVSDSIQKRGYTGKYMTFIFVSCDFCSNMSLLNVSKAVSLWSTAKDGNIGKLHTAVG